MYGGKSKQLLRELKTSKWLPPYNNELIEAIQEEISDTHARVSAEFEAASEDASTAILHGVNSRNKRAVLAYLNFRIKKLESFKWDSGPSIPAHFASNLHQDESDYFQRYNTLVSSY